MAEKTQKKGSQDDWVQLTIEGRDKEENKNSQPSPSPDRESLPDNMLSSEHDLSVLPEQYRDGEDERSNSLRQLLQTAGEKNVKLRQRLERETETNKQLAQQVSDLQSRLSQRRDELRETNSLLHHKNQALEQAVSNVAELSDQKSSLEEQLQKLEATADRADLIKSAKQTKSMEDIESRLADAEKTIVRLQSKLTSSQAENEKQNRSGRALNNELLRVQKKNKQLLAEAGSLHTRIDNLKSRLSALENETKKADLKAEAMLRYGQEQARMLAPFQEKIDLLKKSLAEQEELLAQTRRELDLNREGKLKLQEQLNAKQAELDKLKELYEQPPQKATDLSTN